MHQASHTNPQFVPKSGYAAPEGYTSSRVSAFWTKLWLSAVMLSRLAGIALNAAEIVVISLWPEVAEASLVRGQINIGAMPGGKAQIFVIFASGLLLIATLALYVLSAFWFLRWLRLAYGNLSVLSQEPRWLSAGRAVAIWFVPLANLVVPYWVFKELWRLSDPEIGLAELAPEAQPLQFMHAGQSLITTWWLLFLGAVAARAWSWFFSRQAIDLGDWVLACWFELSASALTLLSAVWAIRVVREITERQDERFANLQLWQKRRAEATAVAQGFVVSLSKSAPAR
jgi:hypothetical protein